MLPINGLIIFANYTEIRPVPTIPIVDPKGSLTLNILLPYSLTFSVNLFS